MPKLCRIVAVLTMGHSQFPLPPVSLISLFCCPSIRKGKRQTKTDKPKVKIAFGQHLFTPDCSQNVSSAAVSPLFVGFRVWFSAWA